jgi:hypothetical protein
VSSTDEALENLDALLRVYDQTQKFPRVADHDHQSVLNWVAANAPLGEKEEEYLGFKEDLISIRSSTAGNSKSKIEEFLRRKLAQRNWSWPKVCGTRILR